ncbi:metal ABC transporter substrate-binding protein [Chengkuizengella marina]|uniref:Metal ABC transporter substrate-binding protein n=1 Tax=Chengkuizengella marina TaxID=2507566 RepID=A0A6N9Q1S0_9BACL|nr:metal ABC transporter substrate-binding protein [Chengkuizengella marina]NBI28893.1 metal ABC transporter substrate-binding protein [Chengkuizengella marina]
MGLVGCSTDESENGSEGDKLQVVTTYSILYDIVKNVGGDQVEVHSMVPIGANPHEFDPLPSDVEKTQDADAVFYNGLNLEAGNSWFSKLLETTGKSGEDAPVFRLSEGVEVKYLTTAGKENESDPHAWLDVRNGIIYAENARDALKQVDPDHAEIYDANAATYIAQLEELHQQAVDRFNEIPKEDRFLVTSEGAFKYFSAAYDFDAGYVWEINAENQGTPSQVSAIVDLIREREVPVLFLETSIDPRSMETVSNETGVPIFGKVFTDSVGKPGEDGDTYIEMMEWNIDMIYNGVTSK